MKVKELKQMLNKYDDNDIVGRKDYGQDTTDWYPLAINELIIEKEREGSSERVD